QVHRSLAALYRARGRRADAERASAAARATIAALANELEDEVQRADFIRQTTALLPPQPAGAKDQAGRQVFGGLTAREREVATLTAQGASNRMIADALFISERTVEVHVRNILHKLGFTSRAQIAAWAAQQGLIQPGA
ncbi:MAG: helix-turn-helix domain-containing protein, partial [Thermomicrobiales bacterium]